MPTVYGRHTNWIINPFTKMNMRKINKYCGIVFSVFIAVILFSSCEKFLNPEQELNIVEDQLYNDWYEYRSIEMGMYGLQQELVEQLVVLGELRGDLLTVTENADADLIEIYNFNISENNKYASPTNFFKLINACNNFIRILEIEHPEVLDPEIPTTNYDKLYGEALCMRAWAYFNAVRIYGKVPFIPESLVTIEEIEKYVDSPGTYVDSVYISFSTDGYYNDTLYNHPITLEKNLYDQKMVIDYFTNQLENEVKAIGVIHYINNDDDTWEQSIWSDWAMHALLGIMHLTDGNYKKASSHFDVIMYNFSETRRYHLDYALGFFDWSNIFTSIDNREHIYTIWFDKANYQQNELQSLFEIWPPHNYMLKPTRIAVDLWETIWRGQQINMDLANPMKSRMTSVGFPSDIFRGQYLESENLGASYAYIKGGNFIPVQDYVNMLLLRAEEDYRSSVSIMEGYDTVVYKYSIGKGRFDQDANFLVYRAAGIHLYSAELYTWWEDFRGGEVKPFIINAVNILNDGSNYDPGFIEMGVRGRVSLSNGYDAVSLNNIIFIHDPYTNKIIGYRNLEGNFQAKQLLLEDHIMDERARELAYEGERYYDLMRVAKRRNDPSYLAKKVSAKYPAGERDRIYNLLLNEYNWYIHAFD